ncbi:hypothetical protein [Streptomyces sp. SID13031]|uniref:hypothetical protein n=1 Tax=Streptomyces sp. SID13031 TaxID=2706046 RepID=UPI0013CCAC64|nr:hypothetical protein [Streptomyces sp. SID13031]NEA31294.1 hypothetical protein [Streptomyces sp. SID13031]
MSQFELETRYHLHSPGGAVRLATYRATAFATVVGLLVLLGSGWVDRRVIKSSPDGLTDEHLHRTGLDLYLLEPLVLVVYLAALVLAVVRPPERWTSLTAGIAGLMIVLLTLPLAIDDHSIGDTRYDDTWSPAIGLVIGLWLVLIGIAIQARRTGN